MRRVGTSSHESLGDKARDLIGEMQAEYEALEREIRDLEDELASAQSELNDLQKERDSHVCSV